MNWWNEFGQGVVVNFIGCVYLLMYIFCVVIIIFLYKLFNVFVFFGKFKCVVVQNILSYVLEGVVFEEYMF